MSRLSFTALACLVPLSAMAAPQNYVFDGSYSFASFWVNHLGMSTVQWRFDKMAGELTLDESSKTGVLEARIATASVSSGDSKHADGSVSRDEHLRTADFFNSAEYPDMVFRSTRFNFKGEALESVEGSLFIVGVTRPVKLTVSAFKCALHPFNKKPMCGVEASGMVKRTEFGIKAGVPAISDEVKLTIGFEAYPK